MVWHTYDSENEGRAYNNRDNNLLLRNTTIIIPTIKI